MAFRIILGDITKMETTAIVNAANTSLLGGGGVDGAIHRAAGRELLDECRMLHGCKTGQAKITGGYRLKAKYVIHTPGPYYSDGKHGESELLESCYRSCLELALEKGIHDIAFPSISTGIYRFPLDQAAAIAVEMIHKYPQIDITMVCFDERTKQAYEEAEKAYISNHAEVIMEFCNLPMKIVFQNKNLAGQVRILLEENGAGEWLQKLAHSERTFRQFTCLGKGELPKEICDKIYSLMEAQDQVNPCPLTKIYPCFLDNSWQLAARDISSMTVDIKHGGDWDIGIEKITGLYSSLMEGPMLCFYPCKTEEKPDIAIENEHGESCIAVYPGSKRKMLKMMKQILLHGTLDLCEFGWNP